MAINSFALRTAIYARLTAQLSPTKAYTFVPQGAAYPYARIGTASADTLDTNSTEMQGYSIDIHTFDKSKASTQAIETLQASIYAALHNYALTVSGYNVVTVRQENIEMFQQGEPNDRYWHGVQTFSLIVEAAS